MSKSRQIAARIGPGSRVLIVGLGRSGLAAARLLLKMGAEVAVSEGGPRTSIAPETLRWLEQYGMALECGGHSEKFFNTPELIVVSPGVP